jgi:hypothetical protein
MPSAPAADEQMLGALRRHAECILAILPQRVPQGDAENLLARIKELSPSVVSGPWHLGEVEEDEFGSAYQTMGPHPAPHYEDMIAQFYLGNHSEAAPELVLLLMNNLEFVTQLLEDHVALRSVA